LVSAAWLTWQVQAEKEDWEKEALQRWHEKRKTLPADWEERNLAEWRAAYGRRLQPVREASNECKERALDPTTNTSECCTRLYQEVTDACLSYRALGFTMTTCRGWTLETSQACWKYCGHCNKTSQTVYDICKFSLQVLGDGKLVIKNCRETQEEFRKYRCPVACEVPKNVCYDNAADDCMADCGNYYSCACRQRRTTLYPDECFGVPANHGPIPNSTYGNYTCGMTPEQCMHHNAKGAKCAKHRWCAPDMCIINKVKCVSPHQCLDDGKCEPVEGLCWYNNRDFGSPCNDEIEYTVNDQCINGNCIGTPDYCLKYNVTCKTASTCLSGGFCHTDSGRCTYDASPEGVYCNDGRDYTVEDRCKNGFCQGRATDLCAETGIVCMAPSECMIPGECNPRTGLCSLPQPLSNRTCEDGDPTTHNDTCIDGLCVGYPSDTEFLTLGQGECADRSKLRMSRYIGDTNTEEECEKVCLDDPQCRAFNYAYPSCSIWGTVRTRAPTGDRQWAFMGGSVPIPAVVIEMAAAVAHGQRAGICRLKAEKSDTVLVMSTDKVDVSEIFNNRVMIIFFFAMMLCFCVMPIGRCIKVLFCGVPKAVFPVPDDMTVVEGMPVAAGDPEPLRISASAFAGRDLVPESPARGGVSAVSALRDYDPNASPGAISSISNESDGDVLALPPGPDMGEEPLPPDSPAPEYMLTDDVPDSPQSDKKRWSRAGGKKAEKG